MKLMFQAPIGYINSDYKGHIDDRKSTSRYVFIFGGGAISLACKKQKYISWSTMKANLMASNLTIIEHVWIQSFLLSLKVEKMTDEPIELLCYNRAIIFTLKSSKINSKGKYIVI